jgi:hypothetical protein
VDNAHQETTADMPKKAGALQLALSNDQKLPAGNRS